MDTPMIILNFFLATFVLTAILGLSLWAIRTSSRVQQIAAEATSRSVLRRRETRTHGGAPQRPGSRKSGRAVAA